MRTQVILDCTIIQTYMATAETITTITTSLQKVTTLEEVAI